MKKYIIDNYFLFERTLNKKDIGNDVKVVQNSLTRMGLELYRFGIDSKLGNETLSKVHQALTLIESNPKLKENAIKAAKELDDYTAWNLGKGFNETNVFDKNENISDDQQKLLIACSENEDVYTEIKNIFEEKRKKIASTPIPEKMKEFILKTVSDPVKFLNKVNEICKKILCKPDDLIKIMYFESKINPKARNKDTKATGLIQFIPSTARELGTSIDALYEMNDIEQLDYVEKYMIMQRQRAEKRGSIKSDEELELKDLYAAVFMPSFMGKEGIIAKNGSKIAEQNPSLKNSEGDIVSSNLDDKVINATKNIS